MRLSFTMSLRGQDVIIEGEAEPADESVGIMAPGIVEYEISNDDGVLLDWELNDDETLLVQIHAALTLRDDQSDYSEREFE